jgi:transcriptional regulator with XRE-family HTH domain|nr:phBC6A51 family helix-turn-helix protein [uncultured Intestinibacter sp.]DAY85373.1 MAG TPA: Helix-turn-helix of insertion element transposase [Caudoviricetes sp.]
MNLNRKFGVKEFSEKQQEAIRLLALKELEGLTLEDISVRVGVDRKTLYNWQKDENFRKAVNNQALLSLADYSPVVLKNAYDFLNSKDEKVKIKGVELVMKAIEAQEKAEEQARKEKEQELDVDAFLKELGL